MRLLCLWDLKNLSTQRNATKKPFRKQVTNPMNIVDGLTTGISLGGSIADESKSDAEIWEAYLTAVACVDWKTSNHPMSN